MTIKNLLPNISQRSSPPSEIRCLESIRGFQASIHTLRLLGATFQGPASAVYSIIILACFDSLLISDHLRNKKQQQKQQKQQQQNTNR